MAFLSAAASVAHADPARGTWTLSTSAAGDVTLQTHWQDGTSTNTSSSNVSPSTLGIAGALASNGQNVTFAVRREAADFAFDGWAAKGAGNGHFTFTPHEAFFQSLRNRGYGVQSTGMELAFADLDITSGYIDMLERSGVRELTASEIVPLRALHVDAGYIDQLATAGFPRLQATQYITLRGMHVDGAYINYLRAQGLKDLTIEQVISLKGRGF